MQLHLGADAWTRYLLGMNDVNEVNRLAKAIANLATAFTEELEKQLKERVRTEALKIEIVQQSVAAMLTRQEVASYLKVSLRTLKNLMNSGYLPYVKLGRAVRFFQTDVQNALKRRQKGC